MLTYLEGIHVDEYNRLRDEVGWGALPKQQAQAGLDHSSYVVSCEEQGKVVGTARVLWDGEYIAYLADVMLSPDYQRKGIGKQLVQMVIDYLHTHVNKEWDIMFVLVAAKGKEGFYKKLGFEERPNENLGAGMSQWIRAVK